MDVKRKVILTGMQTTGKLHLGNFLGAVNNWKDMVEQYDCLFFLANQHAITVPYVPSDLRKNSLDMVAQYIACGLDPKKCKIFLQSHVIGHTELMWILSCVTPIGQLERMTQFKDKSKKVGESVSSGLLLYPVLMAADILLYNADFVPTGEDQKQHIELARDIAERFNTTYSPTFTIPEPYIKSSGARIMSLQNPESKMSKSDINSMATIFITDEDSVIRKKIMGAVTDSDNVITFSEEKPGISNLLNIHSAVSGISIEESQKNCSNFKNYASFKEAVAEILIQKLSPIREKYRELISDKNYLLKVLKEGATEVQFRANKMLTKVYRKVGFLESS